MTTIAELGIAVNSESAVQAASDLDRLVDSGKGAEDSAKRIESAWARAVSGIAGDTSQIVKELQQLNARQDATAQLMAKLAQSANTASSALATAATGAQGMATAGAKVGETAEQASARLLAMAKSSLDASDYVKSLSASTTAASAAFDEAGGKAASLAALQKRLQEQSDALVGSTDRNAVASKKAAAASADQGKDLADLLGKINPTIAALGRLDEQQAKLEKFKKAGVIDADTFKDYSEQIEKARGKLGGFDDSLRKTGVSSAQTQAALRQLPAQFTDIFTSLAGGQNPLMVLIQQGGQIKDSFGGIGNTFDAIKVKFKSLVSVGQGAAALGDSLGDVASKAKESGESADKASDGMGDLADSTNKAAEAAENAKKAAGAVGPAISGTSIVILGAAAAAATAAAALGVLAYGYVKGHKETTEYNNALILTGNYAGLSAGQLAGLAEQVSAVNGTTGEAAASLTKLAASGVIAGGSFGTIAEAAADMEDATGKSVEATIAEFVKIAKDPVSAAKELNDQYHFLTASVYSQIVALTKQGDTIGAAKLLTDTYAETVKGRATEITDNLGTIQKAWKGITDEAKKSLDALNNIGRQASTAQRIAELNQKVAYAQSAVQADPDDIDSAKKLADSKAELYQLQLGLFVQDERTKSQQEQARIQQEAIVSMGKVDALTKSAWTNEKKRNEEIKQYKLDLDAIRKADANDKRLDQATVDKNIANINDKYKDPKAASAGAVDLTGFNDAQNALKTLIDQYDNSMKHLDALQKAGLISQEDYSRQSAALISAEKEEVGAGYQAEIDALEVAKDRKSTTSAQSIQLDQKIADARSSMVKAMQDADNKLSVLQVNEEGRLKKEAAAIDAYADALQDSLKRTQDGLDLQLAGFGLGDRARQQLQEVLKIRQEYEDKFDKLERDHRLKRISDNEYDAEKKLLKDSLDQRIAMQQDYYSREAELRADWMNGASRAFANYIQEAGDIAGQTEHLFTDGLKGVEDAFVNAATTGKFSFKSLADSIIADLARIVAKAYVVTPILAALGIGGDSTAGSTAGGGGGVLSGITGGGSGSVTGMISNARTVISVAGTDFGKAIMSGWTGGDGVISGLQGAFANGADYIGTAISSAFTAGSYTAANAAASLAAGASQAGYTGAQYSAYVSSANAASSSLATLSSVLGYIQGVYSIFQSFQSYGLKGAAVTGGAAAAGAYVGSFFGPLGTAAGFAIGAVVGALGADKLFSSGEKYPDMSTSATGRYVDGVYTDTGIQQNWQTKAPKYGPAADAQMSSIVQQFSTTLGMLYDTIGNGADAVAYNLLQVRKTSGKYSTTMGVRLDDGTVLEDHQQYNAADAAAALTENYDNVMGTFLAKAIVSSKSLPEYFKAQFTSFANDWNATAEEVIAAIESVFTRFNGVNDALTRISVNNLKLDETGMIASDSILNLVASMSDLDVKTATAKEKVDALNTLVNGYYSVFYTADEQFADLTKTLKNSFAGFGLALPDTRTAYRAMVEDIDVTTAAGQAMFATMMGLATAADSYYTEIDKRAQDAVAAAQAASQAANDAAVGVANTAFSALQRSISAQKDAVTAAYNAQTASLNDMLSTAGTNVSSLTSMSTTLQNALKSLQGTSDDAVKTLRAQAQATLQSALATSRAGGSLIGFAGLDDALSTVSESNTDLYNTLEDFNRDQGRTANVIAELNGLNGQQLTSAQQTVKLLDDQLDQAKSAYDAQISQYDEQLAFAQSQIDALNGVDNSIIGVTAAVNAMNAAVVAALSALSRPAATNTPQNNATLIDSIYQTVLGRDPNDTTDAAGKAQWAAALQSGALSYANAATAIAKGALAFDSSTYTGDVSQAVIDASKAAAQAYLDSLPKHATGGAISGPGTGTSDNVLSWLSNGEYVMSAEAVRMFGTGLLDQMNAGQLPGFATGGNVGASGSVLEVPRPSHVYSTNQSASSGRTGGTTATVDELQGLRRDTEGNAVHFYSLLKDIADNIEHMTNAGVQIVGTVDTKAVPV
jgi:lambda family phage tail tape measure protein